MKKAIRCVFFAASILVTVACKEVLYSDLSEGQANEMVAVLAAVGVDSWRERDKNNIYTISVDSSQVAAAVTLLKNHGLPRETFKTLGDVFSADGIVGTPFEERARFVHAMNEELSHTISEIAGVRTSRVHIMLPEVTRYRTVEDAARASITIHVENGFDEKAFVPTIKQLVAHSVANLEYENVAIAVFPVAGPVVETTLGPAGGSPAEAGIQPQLSRLGPLTIGKGFTFPWAFAGLSLVLAIGAFTSVSKLVRRMRWRWRNNG